MDGVIADFTGGILKLNSLLTMTPENYDLEEDEVNNIVLNTPLFFQTLPPLGNGIDAVKELMEYYDVHFCSTPMDSVLHSYSGKKQWLNDHFGDKAHKKLILTHRKDWVIGDYLIDDRTKNGAGEFTGEHIHFGTDKFPNWEVVLKYLIK